MANNLEDQELKAEQAELDNEIEQATKKWLLTPNQISMIGKVLGIFLAIFASMVHIFGRFEFDMDAINRMSWTLALLGAPVDLSIIATNFGAIFKK